MNKKDYNSTVKITRLTNEERVNIWVSPATRKKLLILKAKKGFTNMDGLINNLMEK